MTDLPLLCELRRRLALVRDSLPVPCLLCGSRTPGGLCPYCALALAGEKSSPARCPRCALRGCVQGHTDAIFQCPDCPGLSPALERVIAAFDYAWPGDMLIEQFKVRGRFSTAVVLARLLAQALGQASSSESEQLLVPAQAGQLPWIHSLHATRSPQRVPMLVTAVPASRRSLAQRGFNPAAELGRALARRLGWEWCPGLVLRVQEGQSQKSLGRSARLQEVRGLYRCAGQVCGKQVLVVDDVMTTGATLSAIADALLEQGAERVWGAVAARTPLESGAPLRAV